MENLQVQPGEKVLITAGAGGTGLFAVQLAARLGAHVIATASERNHAFLRNLGASEVIDYRKTDFVQAIREAHPRGVDAVLECVDGENVLRSLKTLRSGGRLVSIVTWPERPVRSDISTLYIIGQPDLERLTTLARLIDEGQLQVHVQQVLPLEQASQAHHVVESRHLRGKIVLNVA